MRIKDLTGSTDTVTSFVWLPEDDNYSWLWCLFSILYSDPQALLTQISNETASLSKFWLLLSPSDIAGLCWLQTLGWLELMMRIFHIKLTRFTSGSSSNFQFLTCSFARDPAKYSFIRLCSSDTYYFLEELMTSPKPLATLSVHCWQLWGSFCLTGKRSLSKPQLAGPNYLLLNANGSFGAKAWENPTLYCLLDLKLLLKREVRCLRHWNAGKLPFNYWLQQLLLTVNKDIKHFPWEGVLF